jgi:hypothetical protein
VLVTWDLLVTAGNYAKNYDENRSAIYYYVLVLVT